MNDDDALTHVPAMREFVEAVNDHDPEFTEWCLRFTDPKILAVLTAGWVGELLDDADAMQAEVMDLRARLTGLPDGDVLSAWRTQKARTERAEQKLGESRELVAWLQSNLAALNERRSA